EQVARLDIQMLQAIVDVHQVEDFGGLAEKAKQLAPRNAGALLRLMLLEAFFEIAVRQLRHDDQLTFHDLHAIDGKQEGMADGLDVLDRPQLFLGGAGAVGFEAVKIAVNEFDGLEDAAGGFAFPDLTKSAAAKRFQKLIPRKGFRFGLS